MNVLTIRLFQNEESLFIYFIPNAKKNRMIMLMMI